MYFLSFNRQPHVVLVIKPYSTLAPDDVSFLFSEDVLKSTPPSPILGAGAVVAAADVAKRVPNFNPPPAPRGVCPKPLNTSKMWIKAPQSIVTITKNDAMDHNVCTIPAGVVVEKRPPPSELTAVVVVPPRPPSVKPDAAGCCGAVAVRAEPNVSPAPGVADEEVVAAVVREKGVAEAVGLLKAKLKPVEAAEEAGIPKKKVITYF